MVKRVLGLIRLPNVSTISRTLATFDGLSILNLQAYLRQMVINRLRKRALTTITIDFDGSVLGTNKHAQGSAIGFNRKKKVNVHDSSGAKDFILQCIAHIREAFPDVTIELRMDSAFFSDEIITALNALDNVEYSINVPFSRFSELKAIIEQRKRWRPIDVKFSFFEKQWKPKSWSRRHRFIFIRQQSKQATQGPLQLDLFEPYSVDQDYTMIVTNKEDENVLLCGHLRN